jgi:hypothetical protein
MLQEKHSPPLHHLLETLHEHKLDVAGVCTAQLLLLLFAYSHCCCCCC